MSSLDASARPLPASPVPETSAAGLRQQESGAGQPASTEVVECASLAHIIETRNHRPMLRLQALQIIEGVCRSLDHAHRNGAVHGDVQPENIFVTSEGHVRLIGHGNTPTPSYASCEVLEGAVPVAADDLFSAACTGYQLLAGESAFGAGTVLQAEATAQRPVRIPHLSPGQWRALDRALAFRRTERQPDIESFLDELRSQYPGQPEGDATASLPVLPLAGSEGGRSARLPVMAAGITGIAILVVAAGWWLFRAPEAPVSTAPPPVATASPETRRIVRTVEVATVIDGAAVTPLGATANAQAAPATPSPEAAIPQPVAASALRPRQAESVPADPAAAVHAEPEPTTPIPEAISAATQSPAVVVVPPPSPAPLIAPRPVVPELPVQTTTTIVPRTTPAADPNIYMVPFSSLKVRRYVEPDYPRNKEGIRTAGWVDVGFGVDEEGRTNDLQVTAAKPAGLFDEAALSAVLRWRFAPVELPAGSNQKVRSEIRIRFAPD